MKHFRWAADGVYRADAPHLLYLTAEQSARYMEAKNAKSYGASFHQDTVTLVEENAAALLPGTESGAFSLIDLGPAYPEKTLPLLGAAFGRGLAVNYVPVDVSADYLQIAQNAVEEKFRGAKLFPLRAKFEQCAALIPSEVRQATMTVFLGLTYMNFPAGDILQTLTDIGNTGEAGSKIVVATEMISDANPITAIISHYDPQVVAGFVAGPVEYLGLAARDNMRFFIEFSEQDSRIDMGFAAREPAMAGPYIIQPGDKIVTAVTYRYSLDRFTSDLEDKFGVDNVDVKVSPNGRTALGICSL